VFHKIWNVCTCSVTGECIHLSLNCSFVLEPFVECWELSSTLNDYWQWIAENGHLDLCEPPGRDLKKPQAILGLLRRCRSFGCCREVYYSSILKPGILSITLYLRPSNTLHLHSRCIDFRSVMKASFYFSCILQPGE
jgi:hypothetical protein